MSICQKHMHAREHQLYCYVISAGAKLCGYMDAIDCTAYQMICYEGFVNEIHVSQRVKDYKVD